MHRFLLLGVAVTALLGCGGNVVVDDGTGTGTTGNPTGPSLTCELSPGMVGHICVTIFASTPPTTCPGGTLVSSCPTAGALGTCHFSITVGGVTATEAETFYADSGVTAATAQMICTSLSGAVWTPA